MFQPN